MITWGMLWAVIPEIVEFVEEVMAKVQIPLYSSAQVVLLQHIAHDHMVAFFSLPSHGADVQLDMTEPLYDFQLSFELLFKE